MAHNHTRYENALRQGVALNEQKEWRRAIGAFRDAIREFPKTPAPYAGLGEACFHLNMLDHALESYKLAARYSRGDIIHLQKVADIQERLGRLGEASRTYMAAGELQLRQRELEAATANWQRAVRLEPNLLGAHRRLAMVFQRQDNVTAAVREYLAIARILQMQGEKNQALQMCQAALRLDPGNEDVLVALELVKHGEDAFRTGEGTLPPEPAKATEAEEEDDVTRTVRQMATILETEKEAWHLEQEKPQPADALSAARRRAQDELAEEIFREEEENEFGPGPAGLSKLERDALIGQGIDFQMRGETEQAIQCYERAVAGGLDLAGAHFTLGLLYLETEQTKDARRAFAKAARDSSYRPAVREALNRH